MKPPDTYVHICKYVYTITCYVAIAQHPVNDTFCEGKNATLSCIIFDNSDNHIADSASWVNATSGARLSSNNIRDDDMVTSILTIVNLSLSQNGTRYFCVPVHDVESFTGTILVKREFNVFIMWTHILELRIK